MKFSQHPRHKRWQYSKVKNKCWIARISRYNTKHEQVCVGGKAIKWLMTTQIIEGKDGISLHEFNWYPGRAQNVNDDHDTIVERFHEEAIEQRRHQEKAMVKRRVIGPRIRHTLGIKLDVQGEMIRRGRSIVRLAHRRNLCSGKKDPVAQLKFSTIMI